MEKDEADLRGSDTSTTCCIQRVLRVLEEGIGSGAEGTGSLGSDLRQRLFAIVLMIPGDFDHSGETGFAVLVCSEDDSRAASLLELVFFAIKEHHRCPSMQG